MSTLTMVSGAFTLQALGPVRSRRVEGLPSDDRAALYVASFEGGAEPVAYDTPHDELYFVADHCVLDHAGTVVSPIVEQIALLNYGYIITWSQMFWFEGFCVFDGRVAFLSIGRDEGYCSFGGIIRYVTGGAGARVTRDGLEAYLSSESIALSRAEVEALEIMAHQVERLPRVSL